MAGLFSEDMDLKLASLMLILLLIFTLVRDSRNRAQYTVPRAPQPYQSGSVVRAFVRGPRANRPTPRVLPGRCLSIAASGWSTS